MHSLSAVFVVYICMILFGLIHPRSVNIGGEKSINTEGRSTPETIVYLNGKIYTVAKHMNPKWHIQPAEAMVTEGDVIKYVGDESGAIGYLKEGSVEVDLEGHAVLPGLHDIHMHPLEAGSPVGGTCRLTNTDQPESVVDLIKACAPYQRGTSWVLGHGHSILNILDHIEGGGRPPKYILDEAVPDKPVVLLEETSHSAWVNSKALELAGITSTTPDRPGGVIMKIDGTNEPNGILLENEAMAIMAMALSPTEKLDKFNKEGLEWALGKIAENGITSICDARLFWKIDHQKAWNTICQANQLTAKTISGLWAYPEMDDTEQIASLKQMYSDSSSNSDCPRMRRSQIKVYVDGILESTTAALVAPYVKNLHIAELSENIGMNYFTQSRLEKYLTELQSFDGGKGFDFNIHAIGDRGIKEALNAINNTFLEGTRHRITHVELLDPTDVGRFHELNVIADFQVAGKFTTPIYRPNIVHAVGESRADDFLLVKSVAGTGARVTFSSDWDVSTINPFIGIQRAIERGNEAVDIKAAIEFYTINPAYAMRQEQLTGSLEVGKKADFIVIDQDIMTAEVKTRINQTVVLMTVLDGTPVYQQDRQFPVYTTVVDDWEMKRKRFLNLLLEYLKY